MPEMIAILYKYGKDDYGIWWLDLPEEAQNRIEAILDEYRHRGCSLRGNMKEIKIELEGEE